MLNAFLRGLLGYHHELRLGLDDFQGCFVFHGFSVKRLDRLGEWVPDFLLFGYDANEFSLNPLQVLMCFWIDPSLHPVWYERRNWGFGKRSGWDERVAVIRAVFSGALSAKRRGNLTSRIVEKFICQDSTVVKITFLLSHCSSRSCYCSDSSPAPVVRKIYARRAERCV